VNLVHNAPRLSVTGPDVQADRTRRGGWGRERSVTDRPDPALSNFDLTRPSTPGFRLTGPGTPGFQPNSAWHSRISTDQARRGGWGRERSVTDRPDPALSDFDLTRPSTPGFRLTGPGTPGFQPNSAWHSRISTDQARHGGWGRERSVIDRPGPAFLEFDLTRPGSPEFQPTGLGVGGGGGRGLLQIDPA